MNQVDNSFISVLNLTSELPCVDCRKLKQENELLRQVLADHPEMQRKFDITHAISQKLAEVQKLCYSQRLNLEELSLAAMCALDSLLMIKSRNIIQKSKDVLKLIRLFQFEGQAKKEEVQEIQMLIKQPQVPLKKPTPPQIPQMKTHKIQRDSQKFVQLATKTFKIQSPTVKVFGKVYPEVNISTQQKLYPQIKQQVKVQKKEQQENPYLEKLKTPLISTNRDEYYQQKKTETYQTTLYPITWEYKSNFKVNGKVITKLYNDDYRKILADTPFGEGDHRMKFKMIRPGTTAFGIVPEAFKNGNFIDDRRVDAIKYLTFDNGGGLLKKCGSQHTNSRSIHLKQGSTLEILVNPDKFIEFKNSSMQNSIRIELPERMKGKKLFFFIEMKQMNTTIQQLAE